MIVTKAAPKDWSSATDEELRGIRGVCLDIDDTFSTRGKITEEAYRALWALKRAGFVLIPITGRPAGWCDHIARFWPVDAVVGENGAFTFFMEGGVRRRIDTPAGATPEALKARLEGLAQKIRKRFPDARWASDQHYREYDLAIDVCEDVPAWPKDEVDALIALCSADGAHAKLSSIHVNTWFGEYDKRKGLEHWLAQGAPGLMGPAPKWEELLYIGDSPNDEPMFASFHRSVGVANLRQYLGRIHSPPRWITAGESGTGFAEMADRLVAVSEQAGKSRP